MASRFAALSGGGLRGRLTAPSALPTFRALATRVPRLAIPRPWHRMPRPSGARWLLLGAAVASVLLLAGLGAVAVTQRAEAQRAIAQAQRADAEAQAARAAEAAARGRIAELQAAAQSAAQAEADLRMRVTEAAGSATTAAAERERAVAQLAEVQSELERVRADLGAARADADGLRTNMRALSECLSGVLVALQFGREDRWGPADRALAAVAGACATGLAAPR